MQSATKSHTMMKRPLEDDDLAIGKGEVKSLGCERKRSRKKSSEEKEPRDYEGPNSARKVETENETKEARKEARKERKKLAKTPKEADVSINGNGHTTERLELDNVADKVAKRAEKAKLKAEKWAQKQKIHQVASTSTFVPRPFEKSETTILGSRYVENAELAKLNQNEIDNFLADNYITITDPDSSMKLLRPVTKFSYLPVEFQQQESFKAFKAPTPIQASAWPFLLAGRDVIGVAETGSGKTMAFAVPCVRYIASLPKPFKGAKVVVMSPTRELAMQSHEQIKNLASVIGFRAVCVYGGVPKDEQRKALKTADIVVATPGRLNDLINEGSADLGKVGYVVLDEADRMLDKGFEEEIRKIINTTLPLGRRQTLMFTATWPESVRTLAATFMTSPVKIAVGDNPSGDLRANARIIQKIEVLDPHNKEYRLLQLLKQYQSGTQKNDRILVFCLYKKEAMRVEAFIRSKGIRVVGIHGDLSQEQRTRSLDAFKKGNTPVLVATDVAARGLDIPDVQLVCNYTYPLVSSDYVHRIGRTGRAGKVGLAITFFTEHDKTQSGPLINILKAANQAVPEELLKFGSTVKRKEHEAYGAFARDIDKTKTATRIKFD